MSTLLNFYTYTSLYQLRVEDPLPKFFQSPSPIITTSLVGSVDREFSYLTNSSLATSIEHSFDHRRKGEADCSGSVASGGKSDSVASSISGGRVAHEGPFLSNLVAQGMWRIRLGWWPR